ncbi:MAG: FIG00662289: hypothetical protein [uncultured Thermomicrobiales bacterium]|uniref:THUMP-like domain-containing protein n=1 Tax=uncultured Thermomicrobiales bacterium TaxID=1645740 RepID=A0A6J4UX55_9BACT|nr:MAG: FIG00662289: hypothetical protein [uncultured Thermomicrobiales bacterium]
MVSSLEQLDALMSPPGRALLDRLPDHDLSGTEVLRLGAEIRRELPAEVVAAAFTLHALRRRARAKFARAGEMVFTRAGLEQASAEPVARHRAARFRGAGSLADLCTGIGGDLLVLAAEAPTLAVDRDPLHLRMAAINASIYGGGAGVTTLLADVRDVSLAGIEAVFVDPARRDGGGRTGPRRSEPPLEWCLGLAERVPRVGIKAAPGLDVAAVPPAWEIEFIADERELKEGVLWSPGLARTPRRATVLPEGHTLLPVPGAPVPIAPPGPFLLDPNPAVTRAGLVEDLARALGAWKIDDRIAFLSADGPTASPFARTLRVLASLPWHPKRIQARLRELDVGAVDIRRRGLPGDVEEIRRRLSLRGAHRATLVMTRVEDRPWCFVCTDPEESHVNPSGIEGGPGARGDGDRA